MQGIERFSPINLEIQDFYTTSSQEHVTGVNLYGLLVTISYSPTEQIGPITCNLLYKLCHNLNGMTHP